ncbi:phage tail terminator protein [Pseudomonas citronellolis]|uniref:phage tail terminator protein n=1 Tax=Pseudomonas citronellolis TaxID=53408 RepID=UPI0023E3758A|nr:hypothetical protein [Pseudomonas citronellolis]MDF3932936.1 hypothetical protein [Pseudomonas citronellolis]
MSSAPFDHNLVIARLKEKVPELQSVGGAADFAAIKTVRDFRTPSAYVILAVETPIPRQSGAPGAAKRQMVAVKFGVVVAVRNYRDSKGQNAADDLHPVLGKVRDELIGWVPEGLTGARDCQLVHGEVVDYDSNTLVWTDIYLTQHSIGRTS